MSAKVFLDTNLWIYLNSNDDKSAQVRQLVKKHFQHIVISAQVLGETYHVLVKKSIATKETAREIIEDLQSSFTIAPITSTSVSRAMWINSRFGYSYWDSLIISSALENGCKTLLSEDMQHGLIIDRTLAIINPFV